MVAPKNDRSLLWLHAELVFKPLPWNWKFSYWRNGRDLMLALGPFGLMIIDG